MSNSFHTTPQQNEEQRSTDFPAWRYGPDGAAEIFHSEEEIPEGWVDHPSKVGKKEDKPKKPQESTKPKDHTPEAKENKPKEGPMTLDEIKEKLDKEEYTDLQKMAGDLELSKTGKKEELTERIAAQLFESQGAGNPQE